MAKESKKPSDAETTEIKDPTVSELFAFGLDKDGNCRGARFMSSTEQLVKASLELGYGAVTTPPAGFATVGMQLPLGRLSAGKVVFPAIRQNLYNALLTAEKLISQYQDAVAVGIAPDKLNNPTGFPDTEEIPVLPTYPSLPTEWRAVDVGDLVLISGDSDSGWWEAVVTQRVQEILTLRLRDEPRQGTFVRHRLGVALINPGRTSRGDSVPLETTAVP